MTTPDVQRRTMTAPEIAKLLGLNAKTFRRTRHAFIAKGFPAPLPLPRPNLIWSAAAVERWLAHNGVAPVDPMAEAREAYQRAIRLKTAPLAALADEVA